MVSDIEVSTTPWVGARRGYHPVMTTNRFDEADDADVAEQQRPVVGDDETRPTPTVSLDQANEADILEQGAEVEEDDEDYERG